MGLIKSAMYSGVAIYGVKELSKAAQSRNNNNNNNNNNYGPPPRREPYYDDRRSNDQGGDWSRRDARYEDNPMQYSRSSPDREPYGSGDRKQRALASNTNLGSNQDYFGNPRYDEQSAYQYEGNRQYGTPPPYNEYHDQSGPRGYVEGEVPDEQSQRSGHGGGIEDIVGMLGSAGGSGLMGGGKRRRGDRGGSGQLGSLLSGLGKH